MADAPLPGQMALKAIVKTLRQVGDEATDDRIADQVAQVLQTGFVSATPPWAAYYRDELPEQLEETTGTPWEHRLEWEEWPQGHQLTSQIGGAQVLVAPTWGQELVIRIDTGQGDPLVWKWDKVVEVGRRSDIDCQAIGDPFAVSQRIHQLLLADAMKEAGIGGDE